MLAENWHNESLVKHTYKRGFHSYISILSEIYACADPEKKSMRGDPKEYPNLQGGGGGCPIFDNNFPARPSLDPRMLYILAILLHIDFITYALDP